MGEERRVGSNHGYNVRKRVFFALDSLKGGTIARHLEDLARWESGSLPKEEINARLLSLTNHTVKTTHFYKDYPASEDLSAYPVISKRLLKEQLPDFMSCAYRKEELTTSCTSGSYGIPMVFYLNKDKRARQIAEIMYFSEWAGFEIGMKHISIRAQLKSHFSRIRDNQILIVPDRLDAETLHRHREALIKEKPLSIIGFPSIIRALAGYCKSKGDVPDDFCLKCVIMSGETLIEEDRRFVGDLFGCPVVSRYSNRECGVMAHECVEERVHHINEASYIVEVLSLHDDTPALPGTPGRIVVTDLYSYAMPLIRYDTGDLTVTGSPCKCGRSGSTLGPIHGRAVETVSDSDGKPVSAFALTRAIKVVDGILQFQFIQTGNATYEVLVCAQGDWSLEKELVDSVKRVLGYDTNVSIRLVDEIPPLPSGKRPYIINRCNVR